MWKQVPSKFNDYTNNNDKFHTFVLGGTEQYFCILNWEGKIKKKKKKMEVKHFSWLTRLKELQSFLQQDSRQLPSQSNIY